MTNDYKLKTVRDNAILTNSYVAGTVIENVQFQDKMIVLADFTKGSLTSAEIKIEFSPDNNNWYQESVRTATGGSLAESLAEHTLSATGKYRIPIDIKDRYIRISAKGTGTLTGSSMKIDCIIGQED